MGKVRVLLEEFLKKRPEAVTALLEGEAEGAEGTDPSSPRTSLDGKTSESAARTSLDRPRSELPDDTKPTRGRRLSRVGRQEPGKLHVLVDGGYVNNCPTDVMRAMGARVIVAVDVR